MAPYRVPEQEAVSSVLKQGGLCLETRGTDGLGLAECRGLGANRPQSQVRTLPLEGDLLWLTVIVRNMWPDLLLKNTGTYCLKYARDPSFKYSIN